MVDVLISPDDGSGTTIDGADWCTDTACVKAAIMAAHPPDDAVDRVNRSALDVEFDEDVPGVTFLWSKNVRANQNFIFKLIYSPEIHCVLYSCMVEIGKCTILV